MAKEYYAEKDGVFWRIFYGERNRPAMSRYASYKIFETKEEANKEIRKYLKFVYTSSKKFKESTPRTQEFKLKLFEARLKRMAGI